MTSLNRIRVPNMNKLLLSLILTLPIFSFTDPVEPSLYLIQHNGDSLIAPGATIRLISDQFSFTEGPAADRDGNVFFTDQPNDRIWKYNIDGKLELFMENTGRSNGLYFDKKGNLFACADEKNQLWCISPNKKITVLLSNLQGEFFNGPNDLWVDAKGGVYFTDPQYKRPYWEQGRTHIQGEKVYYLPKGKKVPIVVEDKFVKPNGIIGTPDGKQLYVADIGDNKTYRYDISPDSKLSNRMLFVPQGSDGLTVDNQGNVYLTGKGVTVYNKAGVKILELPVPENWTANVCFGGRNMDKLYITASKSLYELDMQVKGTN